MSDLNRWVGSGRVTRDTELRYTPNGTAVADVGICSNRIWSKDGNKQEEPTFVDVTLWGKQAESLAQYLTKGAFVMVEGRLQLDTWETDEGVKRSKLRVVAERVNLGPKSNGGGSKNQRVASTEESSEEVPF
ncbi:MAG: single-stranded DNA-binding protein [Candidatus Lokiarchaeota archaeon]|jgi:single-strand DNA-binding protein|nr:single-stranded DNA-binding protein [Candidatus Lokiarchaeota archaeon]